MALARPGRSPRRPPHLVRHADSPGSFAPGSAPRPCVGVAGRADAHPPGPEAPHPARLPFRPARTIRGGPLQEQREVCAHGLCRALQESVGCSSERQTRLRGWILAQDSLALCRPSALQQTKRPNRSLTRSFGPAPLGAGPRLETPIEVGRQDLLGFEPNLLCSGD